MNIASKFAQRLAATKTPEAKQEEQEALPIQEPLTAAPIIEEVQATLPETKPAPIAALEEDYTAAPSMARYEHEILDSRNNVKEDVSNDDVSRYSISYINTIGKEVYFVVSGTIDAIQRTYGRPFDHNGKEVIKYRYVGKLNGYERCYYE
jgi:hypothetical protein